MRLEDLELKGKKVFIRVDYNVALSENKEVLDDTRIKKGLQSIKFCSEKGAKVAIATHLGYPGGKVVEELSTFKLKEYIEKNLNKQISFVNVCTGVTMKEAVEKLHDGEIILLENLRFYEGELSDDKSFGEELVKEFDVYINDGFSVSHRKHASVSVAKNFIKNKALGLSLTSVFSVCSVFD